jgi:hypothetical protein
MKTSWSVQFKEATSVRSEYHTEHSNTFPKQTAEYFNVKNKWYVAATVV